jgi:predicted SAM-dependent methyltransferase
VGDAIFKLPTVKRRIIEYVSRLLARIHRHQVIEVSAERVSKLNVGCGLSVAPGWLNVDGSLNAWIANRPAWIHRVGYKLSGANRYYSQSYYRDTLRDNRFIYHDINYGLPFRDETIDFIFSSHFLEHLERSSAVRLLAECRRVLKPAGVLRIAVPDLEYAWELYRRGEKELMLHDYFFTDSLAGFSQHRYAYDFELLSKVLRKVGFTNIQRASFQRGRTPDLELLDNRAEYTLFVEAAYGDE